MFLILQDNAGIETNTRKQRPAALMALAEIILAVCLAEFFLSFYDIVIAIDRVKSVLTEEASQKFKGIRMDGFDCTERPVFP